ncbi:MAG: CoA activase [Peptococcaceae bacterium]|nr:CoA activase [Peptococcaceae bacterium]
MMKIGLDLGSVNTKLVALDGIKIREQKVVSSRYDSVSAGQELLKEWAKTNQDISYDLVVTGYGRVSFPEGKLITEITCQAKGCHGYFPTHEYILDVGGQDAKVIKKNPAGKVINFIMNDKCAAGTGRFLDFILKGLSLTEEELFEAAVAKPVNVNSMCTVFAESEVITLLAKGAKKSEVVAGVFQSTAIRLARFVESMAQPETLIFAGGGAHYNLLVKYLEQELKIPIVIPPDPEITVALGAALLA